jgi:hypothetical protein
MGRLATLFADGVMFASRKDFLVSLPKVAKGLAASVSLKLLIALVVFAILDDVIAFTLRAVLCDNKLDHSAPPFRNGEADITG